jgi:L-rhamnose mutarotase
MAAYPKLFYVKERSMQRICFVLQVRQGRRLEEYRQRHRHVWPEIQWALRESRWKKSSHR